MQFLYPNFLYALAFISIPIIIHLFNFRRHKTVFYSNIQFLKAVKEQNKAVRQLKDFLTLLFRVLAIAALVFAFAGPFIPIAGDQAKQQDAAIIWLDNSFSTQAEGAEGKLYELAKSRAESIAEAYPENTKFLFLNNDLEAAHQHFVSKAVLSDFIYETQVSGNTKPLSEITEKISVLLNENKNIVSADVFLISDFQKTTSDIEKLKKDSALKYTLIPLNAEIDNNILIDSVWFSSPYRAVNRHEKLHVSITNYSDEEYLEVPLRLFLNDSLKVPASFDIQPGESKTEILEYTNTKAGMQTAKVEIDDYPVTFDNAFYFSVNIKRNRKVLIAGEPKKNRFISSVFDENDYFLIDQSPAAQLKVSEIPNYDAFILNSEASVSSGLNRQLVNFVSEGGTLIIFTGSEIDAESYNELLQPLRIGQISGFDSLRTQIKTLAYQSELYENVFDRKQKNPRLPIVQNKAKLTGNIQSLQETIWADERNQSILTKTLYGKGQVYFFVTSADEEAGDMVFHPLWIPTIYNMVLLERHSEPYYYYIGEILNITLENADFASENAVHLKNPDYEKDFILERVGSRGRNIFSLPPVITKAGNYQISQAGEQLKAISLNYKRKESDLACYTIDELKEKAESAGQNIRINTDRAEKLRFTAGGKKGGKDLTNLFIIAALLFLAAEIISLRLINSRMKA
jgi:hypothetical protein